MESLPKHDRAAEYAMRPRRTGGASLALASSFYQVRTQLRKVSDHE